MFSLDRSPSRSILVDDVINKIIMSSLRRPALSPESHYCYFFNKNKNMNASYTLCNCNFFCNCYCNFIFFF